MLVPEAEQDWHATACPIYSVGVPNANMLFASMRM
jgi:hypothetical protein